MSYWFLSLKISPVWNAAKYFRTELTLIDGEYKYVSSQLLFGTYFFLDTEMYTHLRQAYSFWETISDFGGIFDIFMMIFGLVFASINEELLINKFMRNLFTTKTNDSE